MTNNKELNAGNIGYFKLWIVPMKWGQIRATKMVYRQRFSHVWERTWDWKSYFCLLECSKPSLLNLILPSYCWRHCGNCHRDSLHADGVLNAHRAQLLELSQCHVWTSLIESCWIPACLLPHQIAPMPESWLGFLLFAFSWCIGLKVSFSTNYIYQNDNLHKIPHTLLSVLII